MSAEAISKFEKALEAWGGNYESETYPARHGWMIPGREIYDPKESARGFAKQMELLDDRLRATAPA
jgi:carboxymethylenebutenolidase